jgi:phage terminase large subunit-like protein
MRHKATGPDRGVTAVSRINQLTHTKDKWAGKPFDLRPWQEGFIKKLFGMLREDGTRQYRTAYMEIPRKNGKTELAAAIALYCLAGENLIGGEVYTAAADRDQAALVFNAAAQMVRNSAKLSAQCKIVDSTKRIIHKPTGSFMRALSSEAYSKHGFNASALIYDELHAAPNRELFDVLTTSMGARSQPLTLVITTAGWDRTSICWELHDYAIKVRDGIVKDPTFLPVIYAAEEQDDWLDEKVWRKANPALDDFRSLDEMQTYAKQAQEVPARQNTFRRLYLCQWTEQADRWLDMALWDKGAVKVDPEGLKGQRCFIGVDLASTQDITAAVLLFPDDDGGYDVVPHFWVPADTVAKRSRGARVPYDEWVRQGLIHTTPGNATDYDFIEAALLEFAKQYRVSDLAFDRWHASQLLTHLMDEFGTDEKSEPRVVQFGQGFQSMSAPTKEIERLLLAGKLRHGGHPVLRWMASNIAVRQDPAGNLKIDKDKSSEKVDGMVALAMALGRAMVAPVVEPSPYESRGFLFV